MKDLEELIHKLAINFLPFSNGLQTIVKVFSKQDLKDAALKIIKKYKSILEEAETEIQKTK